MSDIKSVINAYMSCIKKIELHSNCPCLKGLAITIPGTTSYSDKPSGCVFRFQSTKLNIDLDIGEHVVKSTISHKSDEVDKNGK